MPKLRPLSEFELSWTEEDYDHEKATKFIHSLKGQIENLEQKIADLNEAVTESKRAQTSAERALNKAKAGDSEEVTELKNANDELQKKLDEFDVKAHPDYLKLEIAVTKDLDAFAAERLRGSTRDEIEKDAEAWLERGYGKSAGPDDEEDSSQEYGFEDDKPSVLAGRPKRAPVHSGGAGKKPASDVPTKAEWEDYQRRSSTGLVL